METERFETVIIGGGQAGLTTGYHLKQQGRSFVILDAFARIGDAWREGRWDSLRLFTPARYDGLPGWRFPAPPWSFPSKEEMASYMADYASRFELPVRSGVLVDGLSSDGAGFIVTAGATRFEADNIVVATGAHRIPKVPAFSTELDPGIVQMHSSEYLRPDRLRDGPALVVGVGNSGAEIAFELSKTGRHVFLAGKESGQIPVRHGSRKARIGFRVFRFVAHHVLTLRSPIGRKVIPKMGSKADPLVRVRRPDLAAAGVERVPRVVGTQDGLPLLADGRVVDVASVIWSTGFRRDFSWIDLPAFEGSGEPLHDRGVVSKVPGLYFVGLPFQFSVSSDVLPSRGRDGRFVAKHIATHARRTARSALASA